MTGQDLKNSILQLAIQGKLVPQDANDEPASVLLERIKAEKKKLIEEKKIKKEKPLAEITEDEMPFEIPESWVWVRLGEVTSSIGDGLHGTPHYDENGEYYFVNGNNLDGTIVIKPNTKKTTKTEFIKQGCTFNVQTIFVSINGTIGNIAFYNNEKIVLGKSACYINLLTEIYKIYISWLLHSEYFLQHAKEKATGSTIKNVPLSAMRNFPIPLPPLSEQHRIIAKIEELMPLIDEYDMAQKDLDALNSAMPEQLKQSLLQEAIMGKLGTNNPDDEPASELLKRIREEKAQLIKEKKIKKEKPLPEITEEEIPFEIPENWVWCRWGDLSFSIQYGYNASAKQSGDIRMVRISDIQNNEVLWDTVPFCAIKKEEIDGYLLEPNDILFARTGGTVGKSFLVKTVPYPAIFAGYLIRTRYSKELVPQYLKFFMESNLYWGQLKEGTIATAQPNCNGKTLSNMILPLPPLAEQRRIVEKLDALLPMISELAKSK